MALATEPVDRRPDSTAASRMIMALAMPGDALGMASQPATTSSQPSRLGVTLAGDTT